MVTLYATIVGGTYKSERGNLLYRTPLRRMGFLHPAHWQMSHQPSWCMLRMLGLTTSYGCTTLLKRTRLVRSCFLTTVTSTILVCMMHVSDAYHNACFGCWLWPTFYNWTTWLKRTEQVHVCWMKTPISTILICLMYLGMLTTMHSSDAGPDLHFMVGWLMCIPAYWQHQHQQYWYLELDEVPPE